MILRLQRLIKVDRVLSNAHLFVELGLGVCLHLLSGVQLVGQVRGHGRHRRDGRQLPRHLLHVLGRVPDFNIVGFYTKTFFLGCNRSELVHATINKIWSTKCSVTMSSLISGLL